MSEFYIPSELEASNGYVLSDANLRATHSGEGNIWKAAAITNYLGLQVYELSGKRYFEILQRDDGSDIGCAVGLLNTADLANGTSNPFGVASYMITTCDILTLNPGIINNGSFGANSAFATSPGDVIGVAVDATTGKVFFSVNGVFVLAQNPATGENPLFILPSLDFVAWMTSHDGEIPVGPQAFDGRFTSDSFEFAIPDGFIAWGESIAPVGRIDYPASLPCPQTAALSLAERRRIGQYAVRETSPLWRDSAGSMYRATFVFKSYEQMQTFMEWGEETAHHWAAWFNADGWPLPRGRGGVFRFVGAPSFPEFLPTLQSWRIAATFEVRGASVSAPVDDVGV